MEEITMQERRLVELAARDHEAEAGLIEALAAAQGEFKTVRKTKRANAGKYSYTYASLDDVLAACLPALNAHGIALTQEAVVSPSPVLTVKVTTTLRRGSAQIEFEAFELPVADASAQGVGSALTYARRYAVSTALGIAAEEDDDGAAATGPRQAEGKPVTETMMKRLHALAREKGVTHDQMRDWAGTHLGIESLTELTMPGAAEMEKSLRELPDAPKEAKADA